MLNESCKIDPHIRVPHSWVYIYGILLQVQCQSCDVTMIDVVASSLYFGIDGTHTNRYIDVWNCNCGKLLSVMHCIQRVFEVNWSWRSLSYA